MVYHILIGNLAFTAFVSFYCFIASLASKNYSWIDRLWSILPPSYAIWMTQSFTDLLDLPDPLQLWLVYPKLAIMLFLPLLWGCRLTYNFYRKGGYTAENEDYRWGWMRQNTILKNPIIFQIFNATFISTYQTIILMLLVHPMYLVINVLNADKYHPIGSISFLDILLTITFLTLLFIEWLADEQQWEYYSLRTRFKNGELGRRGSIGECWDRNDLKLGFNTKGLFSYSRHPNFIAEFSMWFVYATFALPYFFIDNVINNITVYQKFGQFSLFSVFSHPCSVYLGAVLLWLIFLGSTPLTEFISCSKYPEYKEYQKTTPRLLPNPVTVYNGLFSAITKKISHEEKQE
jgi:steroid 5-alpha reductase family enzyme